MIRSQLPIRLQELVIVEFALPQIAASSGLQKVNAEVVRKTASGFAVEWLEFSPTTIRSLMRETGQGGKFAPPPAPEIVRHASVTSSVGSGR